MCMSELVLLMWCWRVGLDSISVGADSQGVVSLFKAMAVVRVVSFILAMPTIILYRTFLSSLKIKSFLLLSLVLCGYLSTRTNIRLYQR